MQNIVFDIAEKDPQAKRFAYIDERHIITDAGNIFKLAKDKTEWKRQKPRKQSGGYLRGRIDRKDVYIHRLVALAFLENPQNKSEVNHKDGNKENNNVDNLEWCTSAENKKHAYLTGLRNPEELKQMAQKPRYKRRLFTAEQVEQIRRSAESKSQIARSFNCSSSTIRNIKAGKIYKEL